ncbi:chorismate pyruvate-lyase family protein [Gracilibacillus sp. YIM 98692]|uniref:chorismate pyruvate-lyase family protein n=1 Tax=Gracilibacillus sp. YIM 98692 TaxID=2663532 RepID=UPI0013D57274|nr:chorismate pyruvate-lyase family protein [Gracilibacillus sp. YIM 98692]
MVDSQYERKASDLLQELLLDLLLVTDGRTTDLLEILLNEKVRVEVIRQEPIAEDNNLMGEFSGGPYYIRESVLIGEKSGFVVSHNIALVYSKHVPPALFENIANRQQGIGKAISSLGVRSFREVVDSGFINEEEAVDLFRQPVKIRFPNLYNKLPYKRYFMYFERKPGIQMLEYYNPSLIRHRLQQEIRKEQSSD